ncbi:sigma-70 family RNA polymerase sigma factor [Georgenia sp. EYE_87]|uniref:RNA polymerase sigma factor n=1 Tax=Georgenia sp. EYE_87 TaxID=2853448 RepID=UPI002005D57C|nr:sigma-70 family RNA polymerase sigma factor [Georgenia sp. EYE_87]MCK6209990.1 sigma-70 family RNA polymerase sigma factor [Georgenia sp. EYE_87]
MPIDHDTAVEALYVRHAGTVHRYVYRRVLDRATADELTNDVFRIAWQRLRKARSVDLPWLIGTAKNLVLNEVRARGRRERLTARLRDGAVAGSPAPGYDLVRDSVLEVLATMREQDRDVLMLAYWDGFRGADLAAVLGCGEAAAASRLFRARKAFARLAPPELVGHDIVMDGGQR